MSRVFAKSWFWPALSAAGVAASYIFAYGRSTKETEATLTSLTARVASIESANPEQTRWLVDQQTNFLRECRGDIASIKSSVHKIELILARTNPTIGSKD